MEWKIDRTSSVGGTTDAGLSLRPVTVLAIKVNLHLSSKFMFKLSVFVHIFYFNINCRGFKEREREAGSRLR